MRSLFVAISFALLSGCDQQMGELMDALAGTETNTVVLMNEPVVIDSSGLTLGGTDPMKVVGETSSLCLVLTSGVPLGPRTEMDRQFQKAMQGAVIDATVTTRAGESFDLTRTGQAWSKYGEVLAGDELSACLSCGCGRSPRVGSEIAEIVVRSSPQLEVQGIYWKSTDAYDQN